MDEKDLICRVLAGEPEAFAGLVERYEKQVYNLCLRMVNNPEDAQDLAQESFLKAWRGLQFYKFESSFSTWLYRLTTNVCIDFLRKQKRTTAFSLTVGDEEGGDSELELPDPDPLPEQQVMHREEKTTIAAAMEKLEEEFRLVLTLRVVDELSYEQIADVLELKVGTVKSRIARARGRLKKILEESGNFFEKGSSNQTERGMRRDV